MECIPTSLLLQNVQGTYMYSASKNTAKQTYTCL